MAFRHSLPAARLFLLQRRRDRHGLRGPAPAQEKGKDLLFHVCGRFLGLFGRRYDFLTLKKKEKLIHRRFNLLNHSSLLAYIKHNT